MNQSLLDLSIEPLEELDTPFDFGVSALSTGLGAVAGVLALT